MAQGGACYNPSMAHTLSPSELHLLEDFRQRLLTAVPGEVAAIRVFGSRARGDSNEHSDLDVALEPRPGVAARPLRQRAVNAAWDAMEALRMEGLMLVPVVVPMDGYGIAAVIAREGLLVWQAEGLG